MSLAETDLTLFGCVDVLQVRLLDVHGAGETQDTIDFIQKVEAGIGGPATTGLVVKAGWSELEHSFCCTA